MSWVAVVTLADISLRSWVILSTSAWTSRFTSDLASEPEIEAVFRRQFTFQLELVFTLLFCPKLLFFRDFNVAACGSNVNIVIIFL